MDMKNKKTSLIFLALGIIIFVGAALFLKNSALGTQAVWSVSGGGAWFLPLVAAAALVDSINPCVFSVLLLTIAFLFGIGAARTKVLHVGGVTVPVTW